jgi:chemotaxis methyl-accepting protein methylase
MAPDDFQFLARLLRRRSGLALGMDKVALTKGRLAPVVRRFGFKDVADLVTDLRHGRESLAEAVTEAMTFHESGFFREPAQFTRLRAHVLPPCWPRTLLMKSSPFMLGRFQSRKIRSGIFSRQARRPAMPSSASSTE